MKYRTDTPMVVVAENRLAYQPTSQQTMTLSNPLTDDLRERTEDRTKFLRAAVVYTARQLLVAVPPSMRSKAESQALYDCTKERRAFSDDTVALLIDLQKRADAERRHVLSEQIRALEVAAVPAPAECLVQVGLKVEEADVALDNARTMYATEKTPVRASYMRECAIRLMAAARVLIDATARYATPTRTA